MSHVPHPPSGTFLRPWFDHLRPCPKMAPPSGVPRWVSGYRTRPLGDSEETNMSHAPHPPSGTFLRPWFDHLKPMPKMATPSCFPKWVSGDRPGPWWTVMKPTCHMFLIHLVEHFCALGLTTRFLGTRWGPPKGVPRWVSGYRPAPWGTVMKPKCHMFLIHLAEHFCAFHLIT